MLHDQNNPPPLAQAVKPTTMVDAPQKETKSLTITIICDAGVI